MSALKVDILAIGVHPDDIELGCGGTLIASVKQNKKVAIVDLTQGELGTRGTIHTRRQEAEDAAEVMGISYRENLEMADGFFEITQENLFKVIQVIRKYQPEILICNAPKDRHPDHGRSSELVVRAAFLSGLRKIETEWEGESQEAWRPKNIYHYIQDTYIEPDFVFDISDVHEQKIKAVVCYKTQFNTSDASEPTTYISTPDFLNRTIGRALSLGKTIGVQYAEGFISEKAVGVRDFNDLVQVTT
ncbi:bacillithiol biosynthesis deacetylase BshB1 [Rhizosphaericola mali]|uniref:Bacillithiol biosynthesis deacetylase BshB1 n=1 Tax=Rhizosphaericola mali TaxID=2545455 RepID=A0A5P2G6Q8_9BACT|nr:bacillithiol biosynthesis deacetylase BshB1 [Rhizosphaericola mali]QES89470.1 bacillithiol biosynthesis deacetylase BshB1 [Rhizosphaericola mali]